MQRKKIVKTKISVSLGVVRYAKRYLITVKTWWVLWMSDGFNINENSFPLYPSIFRLLSQTMFTIYTNVFNLNCVDPIRSSLLSNNLLAKIQSFLVFKIFYNTNHSFIQSCQFTHVKDDGQISFLMLNEFKESNCISPETIRKP